MGQFVPLHRGKAARERHGSGGGDDDDSAGAAAAAAVFADDVHTGYMDPLADLPRTPAEVELYKLNPVNE